MQYIIDHLICLCDAMDKMMLPTDKLRSLSNLYYKVVNKYDKVFKSLLVNRIYLTICELEQTITEQNKDEIAIVQGYLTIYIGRLLPEVDTHILESYINSLPNDMNNKVPCIRELVSNLLLDYLEDIAPWL